MSDDLIHRRRLERIKREREEAEQAELNALPASERARRLASQAAADNAGTEAEKLISDQAAENLKTAGRIAAIAGRGLLDKAREGAVVAAEKLKVAKQELDDKRAAAAVARAAEAEAARLEAERVELAKQAVEEEPEGATGEHGEVVTTEEMLVEQAVDVSHAKVPVEATVPPAVPVIAQEQVQVTAPTIKGGGEPVASVLPKERSSSKRVLFLATALLLAGVLSGGAWWFGQRIQKPTAGALPKAAPAKVAPIMPAPAATVTPAEPPAVIPSPVAVPVEQLPVAEPASPGFVIPAPGAPLQSPEVTTTPAAPAVGEVTPSQVEPVVTPMPRPVAAVKAPRRVAQKPSAKEPTAEKAKWQDKANADLDAFAKKLNGN